MASTAPAFGAIVALAALASASLTLGAIAYARRRRLMDVPGRRRSHAVPTPRGGGIAIVLVLLAAAVLFGAMLPPAGRSAFALGLVLVAAIGWIDDHRSLSARVRLLVHFIAASLFVLAIVPPETWQASTTLRVLAVLFVAAAVVWIAATINFWNFVDGSNGLVTLQTLWVSLVLAAWFAASPGDDAVFWSAVCAALAGAAVGFLPFNFPRARIFLGDVGSGALGFACGALLLLAVARAPGAAWSLVLVPSVLMGDAGLTLLQRIALGRRWYTPHREHLYQWLIRGGWSHARVAWAYLGWNLLVVLPALWAQARWPAMDVPIALSALALTTMVWVLGKRAVVRHVRSKRS